ncbi:septum formation protein Maf [Sporosarcina sp. P21c]|uniref:Maf family protein n=1 Tax=unclassified Sporosarcina TaxID=2647733 RepID=UPI000C167FE9|nr:MULTISPECIES: Maf family protein [unclassified Sporosarcina]PIC67878.1 septum formation protein Maf [Sporosarcina sp. P16a]PIC90737.1 septum formation protein Maf [Sporosarcina sp. P21c]PIC93502.1 septum formation protein Maf [Sporosarcina sp. P25]
MKFISLKPIVLASSSPRRKELLQLAGIDFTVRPSEVDENLPFTPEEPYEYAVRLSEQKARAVFESEEEIVIAADTIVVREGRVFPKPEDDAQAIDFLMELSGELHEVITGVTILANEKKIQFAGLSQVKFRKLDEELVHAYVKSGDASDKAGAYGIQTQGMLFVENMVGDYQNIVGLPISELVNRMRQEGLLTLEGDA